MEFNFWLDDENKCFLQITDDGWWSAFVLVDTSLVYLKQFELVRWYWPTSHFSCNAAKKYWETKILSAKNIRRIEQQWKKISKSDRSKFCNICCPNGNAIYVVRRREKSIETQQNVNNSMMRIIVKTTQGDFIAEIFCFCWYRFRKVRG